MRTAGLMVLLAASVVVLAGCGSAGARCVALSGGDGYDRGLVICLSGAGGIAGEVGRIHQGLIDGGARCAVESFEWSSGSILADQADLRANKAKARILACRIEKYLTVHHDCPVHLVGVSAGTGLVVWALEDLPPDCHVANVVLIASSLSQQYDLAAALGHVGGRLVVHYSPVDTVLGVLVPATGTVDRAGGTSGGLSGFRPPDKADNATRALYAEKLTQVGWSAEDTALGHLGDHLGGTQPAYVRERIASLAWVRVPAPAVEVAVASAEESPTLTMAGGGRWLASWLRGNAGSAAMPTDNLWVQGP
jgi:pimeloyl-ACP methyl ester carboxylesterase